MRDRLCTMIRINTFLYMYIYYTLFFFLSSSRDKGAIIGRVLQYNIILLLL